MKSYDREYSNMTLHKFQDACFVNVALVKSWHLFHRLVGLRGAVSQPHLESRLESRLEPRLWVTFSFESPALSTRLLYLSTCAFIGRGQVDLKHKHIETGVWDEMYEGIEDVSGLRQVLCRYMLQSKNSAGEAIHKVAISMRGSNLHRHPNSHIAKPSYTV